MKKEEKIELASLENVKCPQCGGVINQIWFVTLNFLKSEAIFLAECWSGDLHKPSKRHLFRIRVPIDVEVDLTKEEGK